MCEDMREAEQKKDQASSAVRRTTGTHEHFFSRPADDGTETWQVWWFGRTPPVITSSNEAIDGRHLWVSVLVGIEGARDPRLEGR